MQCYICDTPAQPIVHPDFSEYACPQLRHLQDFRDRDGPVRNA